MCGGSGARREKPRRILDFAMQARLFFWSCGRTKGKAVDDFQQQNGGVADAGYGTKLIR
jgi:hypothetical protein